MDIVRQSLAITFVFALLWAALKFLRKRGTLQVRIPKRDGGRSLLQSRGKLALGPQHSVHVLRVGERDVALAVHPSGVTLLFDLAATPPDARASSITRAAGRA